MWNDTAVTRRLGIRYPIVQGPFGGGLSSARLVAAVSNAGGLGSFGAQGLSPLRIDEVVRDIRGLTDAPFAVNLWVSTEDAEARAVTRERYDAALQPLAPYSAELPRGNHPDSRCLPRLGSTSRWQGSSTRDLRTSASCSGFPQNACSNNAAAA